MGSGLSFVQHPIPSLGCGYHLEEKNDNRASSFRFTFPLKKFMEFPPCSSLCKHKWLHALQIQKTGFYFPFPGVITYAPQSSLTAVLGSEDHCQVQRRVSVASESENQSRGNLRPQSVLLSLDLLKPPSLLLRGGESCAPLMRA